jgi:chemotaxis protein MotA
MASSFFSPAALTLLKQPSIDRWMLGGIGIAVAALMAGIATAGVNPRYFLQPTAGLIVLGCTVGVTLISTPQGALQSATRRVSSLLHPVAVSRESVIDDIVMYARIASGSGILALENSLEQARDPLLKRVLAAAVDVRDRAELKKILDAMLRLRQKEGEMDAKVLETAGGFAPTIGVLGTVVGLIDVFRHFSDLSGVAAGVSTAFLSTIYGLALANLILLPAAHRIRVSVEESAERDSLIAEGVLGIVDGILPATLRERLSVYVAKAGFL